MGDDLVGSRLAATTIEKVKSWDWTSEDPPPPGVAGGTNRTNEATVPVCRSGVVWCLVGDGVARLRPNQQPQVREVVKLIEKSKRDHSRFRLLPRASSTEGTRAGERVRCREGGNKAVFLGETKNLDDLPVFVHCCFVLRLLSRKIV